MAEPPAAPAAGPLTVRAAPIQRGPEGSFFVRQVVFQRANGAVQIDDLAALRGELRDLLALQLYFTIKLKFEMEIILRDQDVFGDGDAQDVTEHYLLQPSPWVVQPDADVERRLSSILDTARDKLAEHLESAQLRGSKDNIGGIRRLYVLTTPGTEMARLPPAPAGDEAAGTHHRLPPMLERKNCFWNPQTSDHSCFAWCVRAALLKIETMDHRTRGNLARLKDKRLFMEGFAPMPGRPSKVKNLLVPCDFDYNFTTLPPSTQGVTWADIQKFEEANSCHLRIYVWVDPGPVAGPHLPREAPRQGACAARFPG